MVAETDNTRSDFSICYSRFLTFDFQFSILNIFDFRFAILVYGACVGVVSYASAGTLHVWSYDGMTSESKLEKTCIMHVSSSHY